MRKKSPFFTLLYWDACNDYRLLTINEKGRSILWARIFQFLALLGIILGLTYWGAVELKAYAEEMMILDLLETGYYVLGLSFLGIFFLLIGAGIAVASVFYEEKREKWLRAFVIQRDLSLYSGISDLFYGYLFFFLLTGLPFLFSGLFIWWMDLSRFISESIIFILLTVSLLILGNFFVGLFLAMISPQRRKYAVYGVLGVLMVLVLYVFILLDLELFMDNCLSP